MRTFAEIRVLSGFKSQENLAKVSNCTRSAVAKWETGLSYPSAQKLVKLASVLGVTEGEIIKAIVASKQNN